MRNVAVGRNLASQTKRRTNLFRNRPSAQHASLLARRRQLPKTGPETEENAKNGAVEELRQVSLRKLLVGVPGFSNPASVESFVTTAKEKTGEQPDLVVRLDVPNVSATEQLLGSSFQADVQQALRNADSLARKPQELQPDVAFDLNRQQFANEAVTLGKSVQVDKTTKLVTMSGSRAQVQQMLSSLQVQPRGIVSVQTVQVDRSAVEKSLDSRVELEKNDGRSAGKNRNQIPPIRKPMKRPQIKIPSLLRSKRRLKENSAENDKAKLELQQANRETKANRKLGRDLKSELAEKPSRGNVDDVNKQPSPAYDPRQRHQPTVTDQTSQPSPKARG